MITCLVCFNTYTLLETEVIILLDLLLQIFLQNLKILIAFVVRRQEAPDFRQLFTWQRGQFGYVDATVDVMHVSLRD